jgi:hypothetical protein
VTSRHCAPGLRKFYSWSSGKSIGGTTTRSRQEVKPAVAVLAWNVVEPAYEAVIVWLPSARPPVTVSFAVSVESTSVRGTVPRFVVPSVT